MPGQMFVLHPDLSFPPDKTTPVTPTTPLLATVNGSAKLQKYFSCFFLHLRCFGNGRAFVPTEIFWRRLVWGCRLAFV